MISEAKFRVLGLPKRGSTQYHFELKSQFARVTDYLYLCSNEAVQQTSKLRRLSVTAEVSLCYTKFSVVALLNSEHRILYLGWHFVF